MSKKLIAKTMLSLVAGSFLLSCSANIVPEREYVVKNEDLGLVSGDPISKQISGALKTGLGIDMETFVVSIPSKVEDKENVLDFSSAEAKIRLGELSLHGLEVSLDAGIDYNGIEKDVNLTLENEELYFSLVDHSAGDGFRFKSSIAESFTHAGGYDETTRGTLYYEYGSLDYFVYSIFESFDIPSLSLDLTSNGEKAEFDIGAIVDSTNAIEEVTSHTFLWNLPIGEETLPIGLFSNQEGTLNRISFPYGSESYEFSNGVKVAFEGRIEPFKAVFTLPYQESDYLELEDSLELVKSIGEKISNKKFGVEASLALTHIEGAVEGSDVTFAREEVTETGLLNIDADVDLSSSYHDVTAQLSLQSAGKTNSVKLHIDDDEGSARCYFDIHSGIFKGYSSVSAFSNLFSALGKLTSNEQIQNPEILELLSGLLATSDSISAAIDGIKNSTVMTDITEGHYEGILSALTDISHSNNRVCLTLDLTKAGGHGELDVVLDSSAANLVEIVFLEAGIVTDTTPNLSLLLTGSLYIRDYQKHDFNKTGYPEYRHIPSLASSLEKFTDTNQLSARLDGYIRKKGTEAVTSYTAPGWNGNLTLNEEGFTFSGSMGFDLVEKTGAGKITFVDRKEKYFNDHNLALDITGDKRDGDSNEKDFAGNEGNVGETGYMLVQYDSKNASTANSDEKRTDPTNAPLKGRFSIHSLDEVLDIVASLLNSTDPRFKRLTNLVSNVMDQSLLTAILDGYYVEALAGGFFASSTLTNNSITLVTKTGFIYSNSELRIRILFGEDYLDTEGVLQPGKISKIEIFFEEGNSTKGTDIYACVSLHSATFPNSDIGFNFVNKNGDGDYSLKSGYSTSDFTSFSSIDRLLDFLLGTMTLGVTNYNKLSTYHISFSITADIPLGSGMDIDISGDAFIYLDGTNVKVLVCMHYKKSKMLTGALVNLIDEESWVNIFFESDGEDSDGDLYITRSVESSEMTTKRRVTGKNFMANIGDWLVYILNLGKTISDNLGGSSLSTGAIHGEDLIKGFATAGTFNNPEWDITLGLQSLLPSSFGSWISIADPVVKIGGSTVSYSETVEKEKGKYETTNYSKRTLSSLSTDVSVNLISILEATAEVDIKMENAKNGQYTNAWTNSTANIYWIKHTSKLWGAINYYDIQSYTGSPNNMFYGSHGKSASNSDYTDTPYSEKP